MRVLCTGDVHIGRGPSRLPDGTDPRPLSCGACWSAIVERAVQEKVDLLAISGDVVERKNRFFEALGPLQQGFARLAEAGIPAVAVAGNHDYDVLPRLAELLGPERLRLLGASGRWERHTLANGNGPALHVDGWSFPDEHHAASPTRDYDLDAPTDAPVLGLLHCDLDQSQSRYAPATRAELRALPAGFWLLGHVHAPVLHRDGTGAPILYPGSPQAMDPGETGLHGVWLLEWDGDGRPAARQIPLSRVRYDALDVDVSGLEHADDLPAAVADAVQRALRGVSAQAGPLRHLLLRLRLVGRTPLHRELRRGDWRFEELELPEGDVVARIESVETATRPAIDLAALAAANDPPGALARLLLALGDDAARPECDELVGRARRSMAAANAYLGLDDPPAELDAPRLLERQCWLLLDELVGQKERA